MIILLHMLVFLSLSGCISYPVVTGNLSPEGAPIAVDSNICLLVPADVSYAGELYRGSGQEIGNSIKDALIRLGLNSRTVNEPVLDIKASCMDLNAPLVLQTKVAHYEDRATGWSARPDRVELDLFLFDVRQPDNKRSIHYEAHSNPVVSGLFEWGNASPSSLLAEDFFVAVKRLTGGEGSHE